MQSPNILTKVLKAMYEWPKGLIRMSKPRLIMTLLVKNEEEMLEANLQFHHKMGVDGFIVTDNNSTDRTLEILEKYKHCGWVYEIIREPATDYDQKRWVDRMIWRAKTKYHADWVINADADEFWYAPSGSLKDLIASVSCQNILKCVLYSMYPEEGKDFREWQYTVRAVVDFEAYNLSQYSIFERQNFKVIHSTAGYLQISMGNHKVKMLPQCAKVCDVRVYHYNIRGKQQFLTKMINGGKQLEQHKGRHGGRHWRYFYRLYKEGLLEQEYERVIGSAVFDKLQNDGFICKDDTMSNYFSHQSTV